MSNCYHSPDDRRFAKSLREGAPSEFAAYQAFQSAVMQRADGALDLKTRELVAIAVALTTQCAYCLETHTRAAAKVGATPQEVAEVVYVTSALRAGAGAAHGLLAMKLFEGAQAA